MLVEWVFRLLVVLALAVVLSPYSKAEEIQYALNAPLATKIGIILSRNVGLINKDFLLVDKVEGRIYRISPVGEVIAEDTALVGQHRKDIAVKAQYFENPDTGDKITPAGTFRIKKYLAERYGGIVLVFLEGPKYAAAVHRVFLGNPHERRAERLRSSRREDRRITNGCINVPVDFFNKWLEPLPDGTLMFILPETVRDTDRFLNYITVDRQT